MDTKSDRVGLVVSHVPQPYGLIPTRCGQCGSVTAKRCSRHCVYVPLPNDRVCLRIGHIPEPYGTVVAPCSQPTPVWAESHSSDGALVPTQNVPGNCEVSEG